MTTPTAEELTRKTCRPCEGGIPPLSADEARTLLDSVPGWEFSPDGRRIRRRWTAKNFLAAIAFFNGNSQFQQPTGSIAAAAVVITVPVVLMVLVFQKRIVSGLTSGAVKG